MLESARQRLHVAHAAGALSSASLGLLAPVEGTHLLVGVSTRGARGFLDVVRHLAAATAQGVGLVVPLSE